MKRIVFAVFALAVFAFATSTSAKAAAPASPAPADRVAVMYFHRTQRCPTCLRMGGYSEKAVSSGFATEVKSRKVAFYFIDFQDEKNAAYTKGYHVEGPTLIVARIANNKVAEYKNLSEIWAKSNDEAAFIDYVQKNVKAYVK